MENLTVIIPFFNEEKFIEQSLDRVLKSNIADKYKKKKNLSENLKLSLKF
jgi:glycosyltransferase involved in cell wall biosynthesis